MAQSTTYEAFIVHHGWRDDPQLDCMKKIALEIRDELHKPPKVATFVDEADLAPGADSRYYMTQSLIDSKVGAISMSGLNLVQQGCVLLQISSM
jgi:hypothetical protein